MAGFQMLPLITQNPFHSPKEALPKSDRGRLQFAQNPAVPENIMSSYLLPAVFLGPIKALQMFPNSNNDYHLLNTYVQVLCYILYRSEFFYMNLYELIFITIPII